MEELDATNERVKDSIHAFLADISNNPVSDFNLKFFKPICNDCIRKTCAVRRTLLNADMIASCKYFTTLADKLG